MRVERSQIMGCCRDNNTTESLRKLAKKIRDKGQIKTNTTSLMELARSIHDKRQNTKS